MRTRKGEHKINTRNTRLHECSVKCALILNQLNSNLKHLYLKFDEIEFEFLKLILMNQKIKRYKTLLGDILKHVFSNATIIFTYGILNFDHVAYF